MAKFYHKVDQGHVLLINRMQTQPQVTFTGGIVYPVFHRGEVMDVRVQKVRIERRGRSALTSKDDVRVDISACFMLRVASKPGPKKY